MLNKYIKDEIKNLDGIINPIIVADGIRSCIVKLNKENRISLYELYLMNMEYLKFMRNGYTQIAWDYRVGISNCIGIINQVMIANIFEDSKAIETLKIWALEAYALNKEKREHYIIDNYKEYIECSSNHKLLEKLSDFRKYGDELPFDDGPYHFEVIPHMYYSPEDILMNSELLEEIRKNKNVQEAIEDFIVELNIRF